MPKTSTTTSVWRAGGGDDTKTTYAGSMEMVADFYFVATQAANTAVQRSSTDTRSIILPIGAVIVAIQANGAATGGTNPTFDMGFNLYPAGTTNAAALLDESDADAGKQSFTWATATAGASLGVVMSSSSMVTITGSTGASAPAAGAVSGRIFYYVPTDGAYTN